MQAKIWFIKVRGEKQGPFNLRDLKKHPDFNPDTLVWREGFKDWISARDVFELKSLFKDEGQSENKHLSVKTYARDEGALVLEGRGNSPFLFIGFCWL